jgi:hypothetical protein
LILAGALGGCGPGQVEAPTAAEASTEAGAMSIQDIMLARIVPASNAIWMVQEPATDKTWADLSENAKALIASAELLSAGEHPLLKPGQVVQGGDAPGASTPQQIEQRIRSASADWRSRAEAMRTASQGVIAAAASKDLDKVMEAGNAIYDTCEACHQQFWHPEQAQ